MADDLGWALSPMIGGLIVRVVCCASVLVESPVPVHVQAAVVVTPVIWFQTVKRSVISWRHPWPTAGADADANVARCG